MSEPKAGHGYFVTDLMEDEDFGSIAIDRGPVSQAELQSQWSAWRAQYDPEGHANHEAVWCDENGGLHSLQPGHTKWRKVDEMHFDEMIRQLAYQTRVPDTRDPSGPWCDTYLMEAPYEGLPAWHAMAWLPDNSIWSAEISFEGEEDLLALVTRNVRQVPKKWRAKA